MLRLLTIWQTCKPYELSCRFDFTAVCVCVWDSDGSCFVGCTASGITAQDSSVSSKCLHKPTGPRSLNHFGDLKSNSSKAAARSAAFSFKHTHLTTESCSGSCERDRRRRHLKTTALFGWNKPLFHHGRCFPAASHSSPDNFTSNATKRDQNLRFSWVLFWFFSIWMSTCVFYSTTPFL